MSGSAVPPNTEYCAKSSDHTMCKYAVSMHKSINKLFIIYLLNQRFPPRVHPHNAAARPGPAVSLQKEGKWSWTSTTSSGGVWPRGRSPASLGQPT